MNSLPTNRLVVVSNRLPLVLKEEAAGLTATSGSGGLITALAPILSSRGGAWIGWPGVFETDGIADALRTFSAEAGYDITPVMLTPEEVQGYYYGFANEILWPLLHGFETRCNFDPAYWGAYQRANRKFAEAVLTVLKPNDFVWIHDYQLMLVGDMLRRAGLTKRMGFFLHIPFPAPEVFFKLPWRAQLLKGLLAFDLIGFQTVRHRRNFIHCLQQLDLPELSVSGRGDVVTIRLGERTIRVGAFPISIDYAEMNRHARGAEVTRRAEELRSRFGDCQLVMGMDRLDYTKGIPQRLEAFRLLLRNRPDLRDKVYLLQVTVPSRESVPEYERLRGQIERLVGDINGEFTTPGRRVPIHYLHQSFERDDVYAILRAAEVAVVTPLRDGMNLIAKEYCACQVKSEGVLVLSEFAGAAAELGRGALLVNPYDVEGTAAALEHALAMPQLERGSRMRKLRAQIAEHDIFLWLDDVLHAAFDRKLSDFPRLADHIPAVDLALDAQG